MSGLFRESVGEAITLTPHSSRPQFDYPIRIVWATLGTPLTSMANRR